MNVSFTQLVLALAAGVGFIILLTAKYHVHAFFALVLACFITGLGIQMPFPLILTTIKEGFGNIMKSLGFIIVLGTTLGVLLEHTGSTKVMAYYILKKIGERNAALAVSITGFIVGLPVFCDSGFIVLSGLNKSLSKKTGIPLVTMSVSLATGLYAVHCLLPPHPGASAAAGIIGVDFGKLMLSGIVIAIPAMIAGHLWAVYAGKKNENSFHAQEAEQETTNSLPSVLNAFLPVVIPIFLIALRSIILLRLPNPTGWGSGLLAVGDPLVALSVGVMFALVNVSFWKRKTINLFFQEAVEKAGSILVIIGAGGAFGSVLAAAGIGNYFSDAGYLKGLGILFPFLITSLLKTAQGSSTVAIITAAPIVLPLLPSLGLDSENGKLLAVLSMGAGSMMISHANDAYFWVITKFTGLEINTTLKVYSVASILMGLVTLAMVFVLSIILS
ncbi:MAG: GntP family permease [Ginsengibacter sp.]